MTEAPALTDQRILKLPDLIPLCQMSRSSIYRAMERGEFPKAIRLSSRSIGWRREDIERWLANRPEGVTPCADNEQYQTASYLTSRPGSQRANAANERADA